MEPAPVTRRRSRAPQRRRAGRCTTTSTATARAGRCLRTRPRRTTRLLEASLPPPSRSRSTILAATGGSRFTAAIRVPTRSGAAAAVRPSRLLCSRTTSRSAPVRAGTTLYDIRRTSDLRVHSMRATSRRTANCGSLASAGRGSVASPRTSGTGRACRRRSRFREGEFVAVGDGDRSKKHGLAGVSAFAQVAASP
jgi:hypothetical protein